VFNKILLYFNIIYYNNYITILIEYTTYLSFQADIQYRIEFFQIIKNVRLNFEWLQPFITRMIKFIQMEWSIGFFAL